MAENSIKTTLYTRNIFSPEDADLYELTQLAGVTLDPNVFKIVTDLLKLNAQPASIVKVSRASTSFLSTLRTIFKHEHASPSDLALTLPLPLPLPRPFFHPHLAPFPYRLPPHPPTPQSPWVSRS